MNNGDIQHVNYKEKIDAIKSLFFSALDDFKKYYVYFNKNPEVNDYQRNFENSKFQLQTLNDQLVRITCDIHDYINQLDNDIKDIIKELKVQKEINVTLTAALNEMESTQTGSKVLIDDYKEKYNTQYYKNFQLYAGILFILAVLGKLSGNTFIFIMIKVLVFLTVVVLIYNLSITYTFILFFLFIAVLVGIFSFWK
jgi:hypothetical protein